MYGLVDICVYGSTSKVCLLARWQLSVCLRTVAAEWGGPIRPNSLQKATAEVRCYEVAETSARILSRRNSDSFLSFCDCRIHEAKGQSSSTEMTKAATPALHTRPPTCSYTAFRLAEKHFKNRASPGYLPALRDAPSTRQVVDLSRSEKEEDDEVWQAGWWGPSGQNVKKGKQRARGERSLLDDPYERIDIGGGKIGHVLAEGQLTT